MFEDDAPQHPEQEEAVKYTTAQAIRQDFDLLWEAILEALTRPQGSAIPPIDDWHLITIEIINARLRLYERAGLLRADE